MNLTRKNVDGDWCILCAISYSKRIISVKIFYANSSNVFAGFFSIFQPTDKIHRFYLTRDDKIDEFYLTFD